MRNIIMALLLISLHTRSVCERLSAMQEQVGLLEFLVQNFLSAPTQVFEECWFGVPPPSKKQKIWPY